MVLVFNGGGGLLFIAYMSTFLLTRFPCLSFIAPWVSVVTETTCDLGIPEGALIRELSNAGSWNIKRQGPESYCTRGSKGTHSVSWAEFYPVSLLATAMADVVWGWGLFDHCSIETTNTWPELGIAKGKEGRGGGKERNREGKDERKKVNEE